MHTKMNHFPFSTFDAKTDIGMILCDRLHTALPHGSGINPPWNIEYKYNLLYASNSFESMNENGYYCHTLDFTAVYQYNGMNASYECEICKGIGYRLVSDIAKIRHEDTNTTLAVLSSSPELTISKIDGILVVNCWNCRETGRLPLPEFGLTRINFHGNKEHSCCQYGLKDYLSDVLRID